MDVNPSVVRVLSAQVANNDNFKGTAFFVTQRDLLTCAHVVDQCGQQVYVQIGSESVPVSEVKLANAPRDLAWLRLNADQDVVPLWLNTAKPAQGLDLQVLGFDGCANRQFDRSSRIISENLELLWPVMEHSLAHGMSGGPVLDTHRRVIGLTAARDKDKNVAFLVPAGEVMRAFPELQRAIAESAWSPDQAPLLNLADQLFIGRDPQMRALESALLPKAGGASQPVAVTAMHGMAGVGKSWLIRHFASIHRGHFPGGYWVFDLNPDQPQHRTGLRPAG